LHNAKRLGDPFRVVLLDMQMPGMDGEQAARLIKTDPDIQDTHILVLSSMGKRGDATRLRELGCAGYLVKPVKQQMLYDALSSLLGDQPTGEKSMITRHSLSEHRRVGLRLLLAEDNPINQKLAVVLLQKAGYSVDAVENGARALQQVRAQHYNAVLMDLQMPEMDGLEATRQIRAWEQPLSRHIPIIAMTAHALASDRVNCLAAGMDDYIVKPLDPRALFNALERWIPGTELMSAAAPGPEGEDQALPAAATPAAAAPAELPAMDFTTALDRFGGDRVFLVEMSKEFSAGLPIRLADLRASVAANDTGELARQAHNLKGVALNFSAETIGQLAWQLEEAGKREELSETPALLLQLEDAVAAVRDYVAQLSV
jgi:CheY-like chemotaxis protein/HPt (histidine-containing phosphotransfer) domain-containing protein